MQLLAGPLSTHPFYGSRPPISYEHAAGILVAGVVRTLPRSRKLSDPPTTICPRGHPPKCDNPIVQKKDRRIKRNRNSISRLLTGPRRPPVSGRRSLRPSERRRRPASLDEARPCRRTRRIDVQLRPATSGCWRKSKRDPRGCPAMDRHCVWQAERDGITLCARGYRWEE